MAEYEETFDECDRICPYCGGAYQVEAEDYSEDVQEEECEECGKKYYAHDSFSVDHLAIPDCKLNGDNHTWESVPVNMGRHDFCSVCGKCR